MDYDKIILELLDRIKTLETEVEMLKSKSCENIENEESEKVEKEKNVNFKSSKKYRRLTDLLRNSNSTSLTLTFSQIEKAIGFELPESAREYREFWSNTTSHSIALSWLCIGYKTVDVNMSNETVVFEK